MWQADTFDPKTHRQGARLGGRPRHEHDARVPARSARGSRTRTGYREAHRPVPRRSPTSTSISRCFVLFDSCWDPNPQAGQAARAEAGRAQLRLGAEPGRQGPAGSDTSMPRLEAYVKGVVGAFGTTRACWRGTSGTSRTTPTPAATAQQEPNEQGASWCWRCCRRCSPGRARRARSSR